MSGILRHRKTGTPPHNDHVEATAGDASGSGATATPGSEVNIGEYAALERYISTYRDESAANKQDDGDQQRRKKRWWQFWKSSQPEDAQPGPAPKEGLPDSWLETDIHAGLTAADVEERRKTTGWNELMAESENLFAKFLGFFTGPILYGELPCW